MPANHIPKYEPDRSEELKKLMGEFDSIRHVTRIQTLGEVTLLSLRLQAATRNPEDPEWLSSMGDTAQLDALPNQTLPEPSPDWAPNYPAPVASTSSGTGTKNALPQRPDAATSPTSEQPPSRPPTPDSPAKEDSRPEGPDIANGR